MALNLNAKEFQYNPYTVYAQLRAQEPITDVAAALFSHKQGVLVTRYADVMMVLKDARFSVERRKIEGSDLSKAWWMPGVLRAFLNSMVLVDDPDHARLRTLVHKAFTPKMIEQMKTRIEAVSHTLLAQMSTKANPDLIADFALPLPLTVISEMMGVPQEERAHFRKLMDRFLDVSSLWGMLGQIPNAFAMQRFFKNLIALRRRQPQDDLITALVQAEEGGDSLSEEELIAMLLLLLLAGYETTVNLIGSGTLALLEQRDQWDKLKANADLLDSAVEELLRFTNPAQQVAPRYALEDVNLGGQALPKGTTVIAALASANRDEIIFKDADHLDITRDPNPHLAFGLGIHYCLGAPLVRLEAKIAFNALIACYPDLALAVPIESLEWRGGPSLRGLKRLPIRLKG